MKLDTMALDLSGLEQFRASSLWEEPSGMRGKPMEVALDRIDFDGAQPRRTISQVALEELAESIREHGVLEPVSLRTSAGGRYVVNRGERRVRASALAGLSSVPAFIDERVDPYAQAAENLHREDMSPFDLAAFIADREREGQSRAEIARRLGKSASQISEAAALIDAPEDVRAAFESGRAKDTRTLYELLLAHRSKSAGVSDVVRGSGPITRRRLGELRAARSPDAHSAGKPTPASFARVPEQQKQTLRIEMDGDFGVLDLMNRPSNIEGMARFDDGREAIVPLGSLRIVSWAVEEQQS